MTQNEIKDFIQWDVRTWNKALQFWEENVDWSKVGKAMELGGREGGLSLWLAQKGIQVLCTDYSDSEQTASPLHQKYGVTEKISYQDVDATNIPFEDEFDLIVFKSIVGGIARGDNKEIQHEVFRQIYKALKPGGVLLFAENLTSSPMHQKLRKKHNKWGSYWRYVNHAELQEFMSDFSKLEMKSTGFLATLGRNEKQKNVLSTVDQAGLNQILPKSWHYLAYGIATK